MNKRKYTEDEKTVLLHFFTNIDRNVYCATDAMSSQLWAFLVGQYSRSSLSMRDRFLQLFEDAEKAFKEGRIKENDFVPLEDLASAIRKGNFKAMAYFNQRASSFLKKWGVEYGHGSLKDADKIRFAIEGVSQVFTKVVESPFPTLGDFQEKSTRYLHFGKESIIFSPVIMKSRYAKKVESLNFRLMELYEKYLPIVKEALVKNNVISRKDFDKDMVFENTLNAKAFDIVRYLLPTGTCTCLGATLSTRTAESHISEMLSNPIEEVRVVAKAMHEEALKVSPGLLSHVAENEYHASRKSRSLGVAGDFFSEEPGDILRGVNDEERVRLISGSDLDNIIVSSILFEHSKVKGVSFFQCLQKAKEMGDKEKETVMSAELGGRGVHDRMPRSLQHGAVLFEFLVDFGAYRDIQRHRASYQLWQGPTAIHGYDYPEFVGLPGMEGFKRDYDDVMSRITELSKDVIKEHPHEAEYVSALGHLVRMSFEMHPGQLAYVCELRTTPQGHQSYRRLFQQVYKIIKEQAPIYSKFIRVDQGADCSRKKQEENAALKREKLGI